MNNAERTDDADLNASNYLLYRIIFTSLTLLAVIGHLAWEYFNGGVRAHHIMNNPNLPAISNWWNLVLLPGLSWFLIGRVQKRLESAPDRDRTPGRIIANAWTSFVLALVFGGALAIAFILGYETVSSYMFYALFVMAIVLPIHRSECILGFILGMAFTFGGVLPTAFAFIFAGISAGASFVIRFFRRRFTT